MTIPRETWTELQRAETLLFRAAAALHPKAFRALFDGFEVEGAARNLLIRAGSGFPANALRPEDYLGRYPFSSVGAIRAVFEELVEAGVAEETEDEAFGLTERGVRLVETWMNRVAESMTDLDPGDVPPADVEALIAFDRQIVASLRLKQGRSRFSRAFEPPPRRAAGRLRSGGALASLATRLDDPRRE